MVKSSKLLESVAADACLLTSAESRYYFTGFRSSFGYLAVSGSGDAFATDSRYAEAAAETLSSRGYELTFGAPREVLPRILARWKERGVKTVALEDMSLTRFEYEDLAQKLADFTVVPLGDAVLRLRRVKTVEEIDNIKHAEDIGSEAFNKILSIIKVNVTELDIAAELEYQMRKLGAEGTSFDTIVASGANTSKPHAVPTDKKVASGDLVLLDFGAKYNGYCGDMTRTVLVGKGGDEELKTVYDIVLKAQQYALSSIKAGMNCREADSYAREFIVANGYGDNFGHGLGHGVGLDIHESPTVSPSGTEELAENMVISVEPGIYIPGKGGVRIEDLAVVKAEGLVNLTNCNKELIIL